MKTLLIILIICLSSEIWGQVDNDSVERQLSENNIIYKNDSLSKDKDRDTLNINKICIHAIETPPKFKDGGLGDFRNWCQNQINYPKTALKDNIEGKVIVRFTIDTSGAVVNVFVIRTSGYEMFDSEALRIVKSSPKWTPGYIGGHKLNQNMTLPLNFNIIKSSESKDK